MYVVLLQGETDMVTEDIQRAYPKLRKSEQRAAAYMLENAGNVEKMTLGRLAEEAGVSQPTILRMIKAVGYDSFKEIKIAFVERRMKSEKGEDESVLGIPFDRNDRLCDVPGKVVRNTISMLEDSLLAISSKELEKAVAAIAGAERIALFAVEDSDAVAASLLTKLMYLGLDCTYNSDYYLQNVQASHMRGTDVAVGISYSGTSVNTVEVLRLAKKKGAATIAVTNYAASPLAELADIVILTSDKQFLQGNDLFSRTCHMAVVDMLYMGLLLYDYDRFGRQLKKSGDVIKDFRCN